MSSESTAGRICNIVTTQQTLGRMAGQAIASREFHTGPDHPEPTLWNFDYTAAPKRSQDRLTLSLRNTVSMLNQFNLSEVDKVAVTLALAESGPQAWHDIGEEHFAKTSDLVCLLKAKITIRDTEPGDDHSSRPDLGPMARSRIATITWDHVNASGVAIASGGTGESAVDDPTPQ